MIGSITTEQFDDLSLYSKAELVNEPEVTAEQAAVNAALGKGPRRARAGRKGRLNVSDAQLDRMVAEGLFPRPRKIGRRAVRWLGRDIRQWMEALPIAA